MTTSAILKSSFQDQPEMIAILLCCTLFKLGGQITMTLGEINKIFSDFPEIRLALQRKDVVTELELAPEYQTMALTLLSREHMENDDVD